MTATLYKFTDEDGSSCHGGWGTWTLGRWRTVRGNLVACERGLHLCRREHLVEWLAPALWEAEVEGEIIEAPDKIVARKARIVRRVEAWSARTARLFAADCAERVLPLFEARHPNDDRPRTAIAAARAFANDETPHAVIDAAGYAADAAWAAARAAWAGAAAAWAGADAAGAGADAAWAAAEAAWAAARTAGAGADAAWAAARAAGAGADAAGAAEREWQTARLCGVLGIVEEARGE